MRLKRKILEAARLYLILDTEVRDYLALVKIAKEAVRSGVDIVQLRDKHGFAQDILAFSQQVLKIIPPHVPYIINDRVDLAAASRAAGVHIGENDVPMAIARKIIGRDAVMGVSCQTLSQAQAAEGAGADYIGFGSVFKTLTKPERSPLDLELLKKVMQRIKIPVFAIGGIDERNVASLRALGVKRIAVCRAICLARDVGKATRRLREALENYSCEAPPSVPL
jgi:thiamine-phosphate pyrophosphorylase